MTQYGNISSFWLVVGAVVLLIFGAALIFNQRDFTSPRPDQAALRAESVAAPEPAAQAAEVESAVVEAAAPANPAPAGPALDPPAPAVPSATQILTVDDRPDRLRSLTSSWNTDWERHTIDYQSILSGDPPRDGIPSIDEPRFVDQAAAAEWLAPNEPVIVLEIEGDARAYPLPVITWHEIVNDTVGDIPVVVTFCPLCSSALVFDRRFAGQVFEFGVSGLTVDLLEDVLPLNTNVMTVNRNTQHVAEKLEAKLGDEQLIYCFRCEPKHSLKS